MTTKSLLLDVDSRYHGYHSKLHCHGNQVVVATTWPHSRHAEVESRKIIREIPQHQTFYTDIHFIQIRSCVGKNNIHREKALIDAWIVIAFQVPLRPHNKLLMHWS